MDFLQVCDNSPIHTRALNVSNKNMIHMWKNQEISGNKALYLP